MDERKKIRVNIINRYSAKEGITGESAHELQAYLLENNIDAFIISVKAKYNSNSNVDAELHKNYSIATFYKGKNKFLRLIASLYEGYKLSLKSKSLKPDLTIYMTDPPLLHLWSRLFSKNKPWILWSMDLYPEAFVADKIVSDQNIFYKFLYSISTRVRPHFLISLGEIQLKYLRKKYKNDMPSAILPCGVFKPNEILHNRPVWAQDDKIIMGYCGNIGQAHSVDFLKKIINTLDIQKFQLVLSLYGKHSKLINEYAKGKPGITLVSNVKRDELSFIDIHLSSLKEEWINVCVPSKTVSSVCAGSSFLYCGYEHSDNWQMLKAAGWIINPTRIDEDLKAFFSFINKPSLQEKKSSIDLLRTHLLLTYKNGLGEIIKYLRKI